MARKAAISAGERVRREPRRLGPADAVLGADPAAVLGDEAQHGVVDAARRRDRRPVMFTWRLPSPRWPNRCTRAGAAAAITRHLVGEGGQPGRRQRDVELVGDADAGDRLGDAPRGSARGGPAGRRRRRPPPSRSPAPAARPARRAARRRRPTPPGRPRRRRRQRRRQPEQLGDQGSTPSPSTASMASSRTPASAAATAIAVGRRRRRRAAATSTAVRWTGGGTRRRRAAVTTPSVPSLPTSRPARS